jgi:hypothetical protein
MKSGRERVLKNIVFLNIQLFIVHSITKIVNLAHRPDWKKIKIKNLIIVKFDYFGALG